MLSLIINEYAKIFHKISTYILLGIIAFFVFIIPVLGLLFDNLSSYTISTFSDQFSDNYNISKRVESTCNELGIKYTDDLSEAEWRVGEIYYIYNSPLSDDSNVVDTLINELTDSNNWENYYKTKIELMNKCDMTERALAESRALDYRIKDNIDPNTDNPLNEVITEYIEELEVINEDFIDYALSSDHLDRSDEFPNGNYNLKLCSYLLEKNINVPTVIERPGIVSPMATAMGESKYTYKSDLYSGVNSATGVLTTIVVIMLMVVASNIIAKEFSKGTIKFLLITPVKRSKIFWSKFLTITSYALFITYGVFILSLISNLIFTGDHALNAQLITYSNGKFFASPVILHEIKNYFFSFFSIFIALVFAFTLSSLFRSSGLAISMSLVIFYVTGNIVSIASLFNLDFLRFTIFPVMDLDSVFAKTTSLPNITPQFAICVIAVHLFLMLLTAYDSFTRRNV